MNMPGTDLDLEAILAADPEAGTSRNGSGPTDPGLPGIATTGRPLRDVSDDAVAALIEANEPPAIFVRSGRPARVRVDEDDRPLVEQFGEAELRGLLARVASFRRAGRQGEVDVAPPIEVVRDVLALGAWDFPPLAGIVETPTLRPDGSILAEPGYDAATRLLYRPRPGLRVPEIPGRPDEGEVDAAATLIRESICDFPFVDEASRTAAVALMLTPLSRPAIGGHVPLAVIDSTKAGTGKGLLGALVAVIATGTSAAVLPAPTREEEWGKTLFAALLGGSTFIFLDEAAELASPKLASALTSGVVESRVLGRSEILRVPQRATWAATGNNVQLKGDLARRCYWLRLDAQMSRPWTRAGFRHADLLGWATQHRGELLGALLTIARGWYAQGRPETPVPTLGGFTEWAQTIGGILAVAGFEDFLSNVGEMYESADSEATQWEGFLACWHRLHGEDRLTVAEIAREADPNGPLHDALPDDLVDALGKSALSFKAKLGRALGKRVGTRFGDAGFRVERGGQDARSTAFSWSVLVDSDLAGVQGLQGLVSPGPTRGRAPAREGWPQDPCDPCDPCGSEGGK